MWRKTKLHDWFRVWKALVTLQPGGFGGHLDRHLHLCGLSHITMACLGSFLLFSSFSTIFPWSSSQLMFKDLNFFRHSHYRRKHHLVVNLYLFSIHATGQGLPENNGCLCTCRDTRSRTLSKWIFKKLLNWLIFLKAGIRALTSVAQLVGYCPAKWNVTSSVPGQDKCLDCGFGSWLGFIQTNQCFSTSLSPTLLCI